ncbi:unnamed protein product [Candidula unifasciata]|uniref:Uncharacterized protein n=1 Tax=Candidula unifasciata TaxID=100452 RepID=A0A8S3YSF0_9EUPU|nr:unnamed protein product [Candidula unifasciata]
MSQDPESSELSVRSIASSRQSLLENAPKLTNEQLEQLLSEAHFPMSSRLQGLREDSDKLWEEEESAETIKAETWKVIKDVNLNEADYLDERFPELAEIDRELQNFIDISNNADMNISNNHNRNIFSNIHNTKDNPQQDPQRAAEFVPVSPSLACSPFPFIQSSVYSSSASGGLPRISQSNGICRSEMSADSRSCVGTPLILSRDTSEDVIRFPDISTKSFLVHAHQGINSASNKDRSNLPTRRTMDFVCNDFFEMKIDDILDDRDGEKEQSNGY